MCFPLCDTSLEVATSLLLGNALHQAELTALKKQLGLSAVDADHVSYQVKTLAAAGAETRPAAKALFLPEYFRWAEVRNASHRELDSAVGLVRGMCLRC